MRYANYGPLDERVVAEGDQGFRAIDSYLESTTLTGGQVAVSENMRLEGDVATVRKGIEFKAGNVSLSYSSGTEEIFATGVFSDADTTEEYVAAATKSKMILWNDENPDGIDIPYPTGEVVASGDVVSFCQSLDKLILFRGESKTPLEWDGNQSNDFVVKENASPGAGSIECPNTDYGLFFRNRLIVPQPSDSKFTVIMSDLLDTDSFTTADSRFRITKGSADYLVGLFPYMEDQCLAFFRNSIHLISNVATTSASNVYEITRQYGCVARKSIAASGPQIYFLSDSGVMVMQQGLDPAKGLGVAISKVSGEAIPLSRPIQDQFADVNFAAASNATGIVFDNKYFLAAPTGSATDNDKVFVYDILNGGWSSVDDFPTGFVIDDFVTVLHGSDPQKRRLFACNDKGWHLMEEAATDVTGTIGNTSTTSTAVTAKLTTRSYTFGDLAIKTWRRGQLGVTVANGDAFTATINTVDPDSSTVVHTESATADEEKILRFSAARARGHSCNLELNVTAGQPVFRHVVIEATGVGLNTVREVA